MRFRTMWLLMVVGLMPIQAAATQVTFHIQVPESTPEHADLYISGDFESWSGGVTQNPLYRAQKTDQGHYALTLTLPENTDIRYKFTLGAWTSVERNPDGEDIDDRQLTLSGDTMQVDISIAAWQWITTLSQLEQEVRKVMHHHAIPAAAVLLMEGEEVLWRKTLGLANIEQNRTATDDTQFRIGSITKMFAAIAALQLQREGKLSLMDKLSDVVPDLVFDNPWEATHPLRIRHLLEHTTGWHDLHFSEYANNNPTPVLLRDNLAQYPATRTSRWAPGTRFAYSNKGATAVAAVVEALTGLPYEQYVAERIFAPLGMTHATYINSDYHQQWGITPYDGQEAKAYWHIMDRAAGSVNASIKDMQALLTLYLSRGKQGKDVLLPAELADMESAQTSLSAQAGIPTGYGLANYPTRVNGHVFRGHGGSINDALADLQYSPQLNRGYVLMTSAANQGFSEIQHLLQGFLTRDTPAEPAETISKPPSEQFLQAQGYYRLSNTRNQYFNFITDIMTLGRLSVDQEKLRFKGLLQPNDIRNFTPVDSNLAVYDQNNEPGLTLVDDPIGGRMLAMGNRVYRPVFAAAVWGILAAGVFWVICAIVSIVWPVVSMIRVRHWKTLESVQRWARLGPFLPLLVFVVVVAVFGNMDIRQIGTFGIGSVTVWLATILYALCTVVGAITAFVTPLKSQSGRVWVTYTLIMLSHVLMCLYLWQHGMIGLQTWG